MSYTANNMLILLIIKYAVAGFLLMSIIEWLFMLLVTVAFISAAFILWIK